MLRQRRRKLPPWLPLLPPLGAVGLGTYLAWAPGAGGALATALAASFGAGAGVVALTFALDATRIRRAFRHLRAGKGALGRPEPEPDLRTQETILRLRRQVDRLSAIRDLALIANDDVCLERVLERSLTTIGDLLGTREIAVFLVEDEALAAVGHRLGERIRVRGEKELAVRPREAAQAWEERRTVVEGGGRSALRAATLLVADGEVMGALEVRLERDPFPPEARELARELEGLAKHLALAIRKPTLYDRAVVDGLTRLYTKRHFLEQAGQQMAQRRRLGTPLSLVILDVDHFKQVNDVHGHVAGDLVLAEVARRVRTTVRGYDQAFRYGGEEVVILLPNTGLEDAVALAERLREVVRKAPFETGEASLAITASFGVAEFDPEEMGELESFVEAADKHLYRAKRGGRDQVRSDLDGHESAVEEAAEEAAPELERAAA
ncbi:MAG: diguanylate cyclase [Planctomycetota bacterium]